MRDVLSERPRPIVLVGKSRIRNDCMSPSSLELYDLMHLITCAQAEMRWLLDWRFCPVCMAQLDENGSIPHRLREHS